MSLRLHALVLGCVDMRETFETARYLRGDHDDAPGHNDALPERVRRTLETGMLVTYARPFVQTRGRSALSPSKDLTPELRASHNDLLERRHQVYAHTDATSLLRRIHELSDPAQLAAWLPGPVGVLTELSYSPTDEVLLDLIELANAHLRCFIDAIERIKQRPLAEARPAGSS